MAGIDLAMAESQLTMYMDAEKKVLLGQAYSMGDRSLTRADLKEIRAGIEHWDGKVKRLSRSSRGGMKVRRVVVVE